MLWYQVNHKILRQISQANHLLQSESDTQDKGIKSIHHRIKPSQIKNNNISSQNRKKIHQNYLMYQKCHKKNIIKNTQEYLIHKNWKIRKSTQLKPMTSITEIHKNSQNQLQKLTTWMKKPVKVKRGKTKKKTKVGKFWTRKCRRKWHDWTETK